MPSRHGLGRGLDALIPEAEEQAEVAISSIALPNNQPRTVFTEMALMELASSIKQHGILQPLVVATSTQDEGDSRFELIAGERRLRAAKLAGLKTVPVHIRSAEQGSRFELALIENLQRSDLSPLEEARAYQKLLETGLTQEALSSRLGKSRSKITNTLRLLNLPPEAAAALADGRISAGHAQAILAQEPLGQRSLLEAILKHSLSVREAERWRHPLSRAAVPKDKNPASKHPWLTQLEGKLGTRVELRGSDQRGRLVLYYASTEELDGLLERLGLESE